MLVQGCKACVSRGNDSVAKIAPVVRHKRVTLPLRNQQPLQVVEGKCRRAARIERNRFQKMIEPRAIGLIPSAEDSQIFIKLLIHLNTTSCKAVPFLLRPIDYGTQTKKLVNR